MFEPTQEIPGQLHVDESDPTWGKDKIRKKRVSTPPEQSHSRGQGSLSTVGKTVSINSGSIPGPSALPFLATGKTLH